VSALRNAWVIARKDARIEWRARDNLTVTVLFAALVIVLCSLSFYLDDATAQRTAPGVLWIAIAFSGILSMSRSWAREREQGAMRALLLAPISRASIYLGKGLVLWFGMTLLQALYVPLIAVLFHIDLTRFGPSLFALVTLGTLGFVATGTLFAALSIQSSVRELALSVAVFPLIAPSLLAAVVATRELFSGGTWPELLGWMRILAAFDVIAVCAGTWLFGLLVRE
jgi:heme exporter protein B